MPFSNELTDAQAERLAILLEELGEAQQVIGKILRHGYESRNPHKPDAGTNRQMLMRELGDIRNAMDLLAAAHDISGSVVEQRRAEKREAIKPYLHHQAPPCSHRPYERGIPATCSKCGTYPVEQYRPERDDNRVSS